MPKGIMVVRTRPRDPAREREYNDWYSGTHLPDVLAVPGIVAARRYRVHGTADPAVHEYLAIYELDADDLSVPVKELRARSVSGRNPTSDTLQIDPPPLITLYELLEERTG
jgi:hypothetical protein